MSRIKFRCSSCGKTLAVSAAHAGNVATCPGCQTRLKVPSVAAMPDAPADSGDSRQTATRKRRAAPPNPFLTDDFESTLNDAEEVTSASDAAPQARSGRGADRASATPAAPAKDSLGKSVIGLVVGTLVAAFCSVVWLIVVSVSGYELGILAWGMGGAVGLVAGAIARNPSPIYCSLVACVAVMSVLVAKGIMLVLVMAVVWGADMISDLEMAMSPRQQKLSHAMADQMLADGQLSGTEKAWAEIYVSAWFSGEADAWDEITDEMLEISGDVEQKIQEALKAKTPEEQEQLLEAARERHPEWIEDNNHYLAMIDQMRNEEGVLTDELAAQAGSELASLDNDWDEEYQESVSSNEKQSRTAELRRLAAERLSGMNPSERDEAVRSAMEHHPQWQAFPYAHTAMVEQLHHGGELSGPLADHAKATVANELTMEYPEYFEDISADDSQARDEELRKTVSERLVNMDSAARDALIADTKTRYPDWSAGDHVFDGAQHGMQEALDEIGTDGTFWGNFTAVFGLFDLLWLFLCATTAFGTAHKFGVAQA